MLLASVLFLIAIFAFFFTFMALLIYGNIVAGESLEPASLRDAATPSALPPAARAGKARPAQKLENRTPPIKDRARKARALAQAS